jgi:biopolymer transport protein ExbB/TolQ
MGSETGINYLIDFANSAIYPAQGLLALYGVFCVVLVMRRIKVKRFASAAAAQQFLEELRPALQQGQFDQVAQICDSPPYWAKAVPQLILEALANAGRDPQALRRLLAERFDREVLSELQYRMAWINTVIKAAPMLGLLGTVLGMIGAFGKIAVAQRSGVDPKVLADNISFALVTTAVGLLVAIPLMLCMSMIQVRLGRLMDHVQQHLGAFLDEFDAARKPPQEG